jgi:hypothetical protein
LIDRHLFLSGKCESAYGRRYRFEIRQHRAVTVAFAAARLMPSVSSN